MPNRQRLGLRQVRALKPDAVAWDSTLPGFGIRRQRSKQISYVLFYRTREGRQRWYTIGRHGAPWTPESAREEAQRLLGDVANKADPAAEKRTARNAQTICQLCDLYLEEAAAGRQGQDQGTGASARARRQRHREPHCGTPGRDL